MQKISTCTDIALSVPSLSLSAIRAGREAIRRTRLTVRVRVCVCQAGVRRRVPRGSAHASDGAGAADPQPRRVGQAGAALLRARAGHGAARARLRAARARQAHRPRAARQEGNEPLMRYASYSPTHSILFISFDTGITAYTESLTSLYLLQNKQKTYY